MRFLEVVVSAGLVCKSLLTFFALAFVRVLLVVTTHVHFQSLLVLKGLLAFHTNEVFRLLMNYLMSVQVSSSRKPSLAHWIHAFEWLLFRVFPEVCLPLRELLKDFPAVPTHILISFVGLI